MSKMHVKTGDQVLILSGKDKGKKGRVHSVDPSKRMVVVEGVNMATKHQKPRRQGETGGIIKQENPIYACKVMHICKECGMPTRVARKNLGSGNKRYCKKCGEMFD